VGTTADGESIYQFTHRTFMEYFAALYLARSYRVPEQIFQVLRPHILAADWGLVPLLAVQILGRRFDEGADDFVVELIANAHEGHGRANVAPFLMEMMSNIPLGYTARQLVDDFLGAEDSLDLVVGEKARLSTSDRLGWQQVDGSKLVAAVAYDPERREIHARFHNGAHHVYADCDQATWLAFMEPAASKGEFIERVLARRETRTRKRKPLP
jgi:hypothetical protein